MPDPAEALDPKKPDDCQYRSIYQKLEVASREELMLYIELFRCCGRLEELTGDPMETE